MAFLLKRRDGRDIAKKRYCTFQNVSLLNEDVLEAKNVLSSTFQNINVNKKLI
jgi:hypothetical protein